MSLSKRRKVIVGAGGAAWWVLEGLDRCGIPVDGFVVTHDRWGKTKACGLPVWSPKDWSSMPLPPSDYLAVIGIMNPSVDESKLRLELLQSGWREVMTFTEFASKIFEEEGINCCMLDPAKTFSDEKSLLAARNLLSDEKSRYLFDGFLKYVRRLDESGLPPIDEVPYFPSDLSYLPKRLRFLDLGAYDGDTLLIARERGYEIEAAICFEPDSESFKKLAKSKVQFLNTICLPLAVSEKTTKVTFSNSGDTGSKVLSEGSEIIQSVTLDDSCYGFAPNFIKMDIEGSEYEALLGATKILERNLPRLAISVYHTPKDIWRIPILISRIYGPDTEYFLRRHSRAIADTVLYVAPKG